jgi:hypothetical protein
LLKHRSDIVLIFKTFHKMIQTQFSRIIKLFRSNNAQEYNDTSVLSVLDTNDTLPHCSCPYASQQNGRDKRKLRHILDTIRLLLMYASVLERFWGEVTLTAVYTINRLLSPTTHNKSPFKLLYAKLPDYSALFLSLVVLALSPFLHLNGINSSLNLAYVVFLAMESLKKIFTAMISYLVAFVSPIMWITRNIRPSLIANIFPLFFLFSLPSSLILQLLYILTL